MRIVQFEIVGVTPYSQSKAVFEKKATGEGADTFEERTWRQRMHTNSEGLVSVPPMAIQHMLADCAKYCSDTVPGKGKATWTKHFDAGVSVVDMFPILPHITPDDVACERLFLPSDGVKGSGKRVMKCMPMIWPWGIKGEIILLDPLLTAHPEQVETYLNHSGKFIGLGRFRPRNGGYYGRFNVASFTA
jgi:hypothetical protein